MDTLRIILILGGLVLLAGIYLWDRVKERRRREDAWHEIDGGAASAGSDATAHDSNPFDDEWDVIPIQAHKGEGADDEALAGLSGIIASHEEVEDEGAAEASRSGQAAQPEEVIVLSLMAGEGETFNGMQLLDAMELCGLSHGEMGIFHYLDLDSNQPLFSVANVLEPGSFDIDGMGELETPGLALFMRLPAPIDGEKALLTFVQQAKRLREQLNGRLTDRQRRELTRETLDELKATARRFPHIPE